MFKVRGSILLAALLLTITILTTAVCAQTLNETQTDSSYPTESWIKYTPQESQVVIDVKPNTLGEYIAEVKLTFASGGFRVTFDSEASVVAADLPDGSIQMSFIGTADIEMWTGGSPTVITEKILTYNLGKVVPGIHQFKFSSNGYEQICEFKVSALKPGDLNKDEIINSTDYVMLKRHVQGIYLASYSNGIIQTADLNGDGAVNSTDLTLLKRYILNIINKFPVEGN